MRSVCSLVFINIHESAGVGGLDPVERSGTWKRREIRDCEIHLVPIIGTETMSEHMVKGALGFFKYWLIRELSIIKVS